MFCVIMPRAGIVFSGVSTIEIFTRQKLRIRVQLKKTLLNCLLYVKIKH